MTANINFVEPDVQLVTEHDLVRKVELAYRICYKSEDKVSDTSKSLVQRLSNSRKPDRHTSPLEHARIKVTLHPRYYMDLIDIFHTAPNCQYFILDEDTRSITGNFRAFHDLLIALTKEDASGEWKADYAIIREFGNILHESFPEVFPMLTPHPYGDTNSTWATKPNPPVDSVITCIEEDPDYKTFHIVTTRDILQELTRHRTMSFSVESTRYCNYGKRGYTFVIPRPYEWVNNIDWKSQAKINWAKATLTEDTKPKSIVNQWGESIGITYERISSIDEIERETTMEDLFLMNCILTAERYDRALTLGVKPQAARMLLPGGLKTELFMTGTNDQWKHFLTLRNSEAAHPQIRYLAERIETSLQINSNS